jgi:hypothetical protein
LQEFRRNAFNTDSVDEALDLLDFCYKIVSRSGLSENGTYLPKAIHPKYSCVHVSISINSSSWHSRCCRTAAGLHGLAAFVANRQHMHAEVGDKRICRCLQASAEVVQAADRIHSTEGIRPYASSYQINLLPHVLLAAQDQH